MKNPLKKIALLFVLASLLPIFYVIHQIGSLNENELMVREIYKNQLDAILYSVNQYSNDIVNSWANTIRADIKENGEAPPLDLSGFSETLQQSEVIQCMYFTDFIDNRRLINLKLDTAEVRLYELEINKVVQKNNLRARQLIAYRDAGYRKMEALDTVLGDDKVLIVFALDKSTSAYQIAVLIVDMSDLIEDILGPKMQSISQDRFEMSAFRAQSDSLIYSTETNSEGILMVKDAWQKREFWLLPDHYLGISSKVVTIEDLVKERTNTSFVLLGLLMLTLVIGVAFLYRNIHRQMQLSQAKSEFVSNVSHEIRTPLALISMFAETLEMGRVKTETKRKEYYEIINKETQRLSGIVDRILSFSQIDGNRRHYNFKQLDLMDLCKEILDSYSFHLTKQGFKYDIELETTGAVINGDRESIAEAIINLLDNAMKYSSDNRYIKVTGKSHEGWSIIEIEDNGIGIAKAHQSDIFEQFYRVSTGDIHTIKGSGLGLSLIKKIMDAHKGKVEVDSTLGEGSRFRLYFPSKKEYFNG